MAGKKLIPSAQEQNAKSQAVIDFEQQKKIEERYRIAAEARDAERRRMERIQAENRDKQRVYDRTRSQFPGPKISGSNAKVWRKDRGMGRTMKKPDLVDPGNGDYFGDGSVMAKPKVDPWKPQDTAKPGKDGKAPKVGYADITGSRFTAPYRQKGYDKQWIDNWLNERGWATDAGPKAYGFRQALEQATSAWKKQRSEWDQRFQGEIHDMWKAGQAPAKPADPAKPAPSVETQYGQALQANGQQAASAGASPVAPPAVKSVDPAQPVASPTPQPDSAAPSYRTTVDGRANTVTRTRTVLEQPNDFSHDLVPRDVSVTTPFRGAGDAMTNRKVAGTSAGRFVRSGEMFFGSDSAFADYKKKEGILI